MLSTDLRKRRHRRVRRRQAIVVVVGCFGVHQPQGQARATRERQLSLKVGAKCRHDAPTRTSRRVSGIKTVSVEILLHERACSHVRLGNRHNLGRRGSESALSISLNSNKQSQARYPVVWTEEYISKRHQSPRVAPTSLISKRTRLFRRSTGAEPLPGTELSRLFVHLQQGWKQRLTLS